MNHPIEPYNETKIRDAISASGTSDCHAATAYIKARRLNIAQAAAVNIEPKSLKLLIVMDEDQQGGINAARLLLSTLDSTMEMKNHLAGIDSEHEAIRQMSSMSHTRDCSDKALCWKALVFACHHIQHITTLMNNSPINHQSMGSSTLLCRFLASLNCLSHAPNHEMIQTHAWETHDELISKCSTMAQSLRTDIDEAKDRVDDQDKCDTTGENHAEIVRKWKTLQSWERLAQRTKGLCDWERTRCTTNRTHSPYDTEPAARSRYAWALDLHGQIPVSPTRALSQLERLLSEALAKVVEI